MKYDYEDVFVAVKKRRWVTLKGIVAKLVEIMPPSMTHRHLRLAGRVIGGWYVIVGVCYVIYYMATTPDRISRVYNKRKNIYRIIFLLLFLLYLFL